MTWEELRGPYPRDRRALLLRPEKLLLIEVTPSCSNSRKCTHPAWTQSAHDDWHQCHLTAPQCGKASNMFGALIRSACYSRAGKGSRKFAWLVRYFLPNLPHFLRWQGRRPTMRNYEPQSTVKMPLSAWKEIWSLAYILSASQAFCAMLAKLLRLPPHSRSFFQSLPAHTMGM